MRIARHFLDELIANHGQLTTGPITPMGILRIALDLRETRERVADLESQLDEYRRLPPPQKSSERTQKRLAFKA